MGRLKTPPEYYGNMEKILYCQLARAAKKPSKNIIGINAIRMKIDSYLSAALISGGIIMPI